MSWNYLVFSSGRRADVQIIGLSNQLEVYECYDTTFDFTSRHEQDDLTLEDVRELADHMIERWKKFRDGLTPEWADRHL